MLMNPGDIFRVNNRAVAVDPLPSQTVVMMISTRQRYWDFGDGECGYTEVADVMSDGQIFEIPCTFLDPINK
jgi:hypothetical protein